MDVRGGGGGWGGGVNYKFELDVSIFCVFTLYLPSTELCKFNYHWPLVAVEGDSNFK